MSKRTKQALNDPQSKKKIRKNQDLEDKEDLLEEGAQQQLTLEMREEPRLDEEKFQDLQKLIREQQEKLKAAETLIKTKDNLIQKFEQDLTSEREKSKRIEQELEREKAKSQQVNNSSTNNFQVEIDTRNRRINQLKLEIDALKIQLRQPATVDNPSQEIAQLRKTCQEKEGQIQELQSKLLNAQARAWEADQQVKKFKYLSQKDRHYY